jgi:N-formylglutamate amidohydrolase
LTLNMSAATHPQTTRELLPEFRPGTSPVLVSVPHAGTGLAAGMPERLSEPALDLPDTDWLVDRLYAFAGSLGAGLLVARAARLVVDLNRPADDRPLYDASQTRLMTGVIPMQCFSGSPAYRAGHEPTAAETLKRLEQYWEPYHHQLQAALEQIRGQHGHAILLDAHSIRSQLPLLFEGVLPDLNLGSNGGCSAAPGLVQAAAARLRAGGWSVVVDGRFKGGFITRHYGQPQRNIHALQLEIAQNCYMDENPASLPPIWSDERAEALQQHLRGLVETLLNWKPEHD